MEATYGGIALTGPTLYERISTPFAPECEQDVQVVKRLRADYADVIPRGNRILRVRLEWRRQFAEPEQAEAYAAGLEASLPDSGVLVLSRVATGASVYITSIAAVLSSVQPETDGTGCKVSAEFHAGDRFAVATGTGAMAEATWEDEVGTWEAEDGLLWEEPQMIPAA